MLAAHDARAFMPLPAHGRSTCVSPAPCICSSQRMLLFDMLSLLQILSSVASLPALVTYGCSCLHAPSRRCSCRSCRSHLRPLPQVHVALSAVLCSDPPLCPLSTFLFPCISCRRSCRPNPARLPPPTPLAVCARPRGAAPRHSTPQVQDGAVQVSRSKMG